MLRTNNYVGPIARVESLTKRYGDKTAVDDTTFDIRPGAITGFLGPNGAGKTTTLRLLLGLAEPTSGTAHIGGVPFGDLEQPWQHVGAVLESNDFHPGRTGRNHLVFLAQLCGLGNDRVDEVLELVGLADAGDRRAGDYSLGMRQRLGLAAALIGSPSLLILDEPANGLDPIGVRWLRELLRSHADAGGAVLMSSHLLAEAQQTVDHVLIIHDGHLLADAPIAELIEPGGDLEATFVSVVAKAANRGMFGEEIPS
jgi:ABC-2 type transport system ATP-binding protein